MQRKIMCIHYNINSFLSVVVDGHNVLTKTIFWSNRDEYTVCMINNKIVHT